jgi:hypothetical protein
MQKKVLFCSLNPLILAGVIHSKISQLGQGTGNGEQGTVFDSLWL